MGKYFSLAVFDLDHTLFSCNSSYYFGKYLYHEGLISFAKTSYCIFTYFRHRFFGMSIRKLHEKTLSCLFQGQSSKVLKRQVESFLDRHFESMMNSSVVEKLEESKKREELTLLLSSSPDFLVGAIAERFSFDHWVGTEYQVNKEGNISHLGKVLSGKEKAEITAETCKNHNIPSKSVIAYTDSHLDLALLHEVGIPVAVNPDKILLHECNKHGWKVL
jgi:HAD superfamily hydrolase (TIGR01490 family)